MGVSNDGWFIVENPMRMDHWGGYPYFRRVPHGYCPILPNCGYMIIKSWEIMLNRVESSFHCCLSLIPTGWYDVHPVDPRTFLGSTTDA